MSSRLYKLYQSLLRQHPYKVQAAQTALLMGTGDFISQVFVEKNDFSNYNVIRTLKFAGIGLFLIGPSLQAWYKTLDRYVKYPGGKGVLLQVSADQLFFAPTFLSIFISTMGFLNGETMNEIHERLDRDYLRVLITNWKVWPLVQLVNFSIVPLQYRVLVAQVVAIFWNTYLAYVSNQSSK